MFKNKRTTFLVWFLIVDTLLVAGIVWFVLANFGTNPPKKPNLQKPVVAPKNVAKPGAKTLEGIAKIVNAKAATPEGIQTLVGHLNNEEPTVATAASEGLVKFRTESIPVLLKKLHGQDKKLRFAVVTVMFRMEKDLPPELMPELVDAFKYNDMKVNGVIREIAKNLGAAALPALRKGLASQNPDITHNSIVVLAQLRTDAKSALPKVAEVFDNSEFSQACGAATIILSGMRPFPEAMPDLVGFQIGAEEIRRNTLLRQKILLTMLLVDPKSESAVLTFAKALGDPNLGTRRTARACLGRVGWKCIPLLRKYQAAHTDDTIQTEVEKMIKQLEAKKQKVQKKAGGS